MTSSTFVPSLVAVEWRSFLDEDDRRRSDWDRAENCEECGRRIVHLYTVQVALQATKLVGKECAYLALGWKAPNQSRLASLERDIVNAAYALQRAKEGMAERARVECLDTKEGAIAACRFRNSTGGQPYSGPVALVSRSGLFYGTIPDSPGGNPTSQRVALLKSSGWSEVDPPSGEPHQWSDPGPRCATCFGFHRSPCRLCRFCRGLLPQHQEVEDRGLIRCGRGAMSGPGVFKVCLDQYSFGRPASETAGGR